MLEKRKVIQEIFVKVEILLKSCYCQSEKPYENCCGPLHSQNTFATSAEALMRSRYSAFMLKNIEYLLETIDPDFREEFDLVANQAWADEAEFTGLKILKKSQDENHGIVEFQAEFIHKGNKYIHHEISHFRKIKDRWYFSRGEVL